MDIKSYLLELIATQKTVSITALGTLYKKKIPGRYDSESHSFLPPKHEIAFTNEISEDDILATFISEEKNISIESANYYIAEFVERIQVQLADHHYADLAPIGKLELVDNRIVFTATNSAEINHDFYGLPSVSATINTQTGIKDTALDDDIVKQDAPQEEQTDLTSEELTLEEQTQITDHNEDLETEQDDQQENPEQEPDEEIDNINKIIEQNEHEERVDTEPKVEEKSPLITDPLWKPTVIDRYEYDNDDEDDETPRKWIPKFLKTVVTLILILAVIGAVIYFFYPDLFYTIKGNFSNQPIESEPVQNIDSGGTSSKIDSPIKDSLAAAVVLTKVLKDSLINKATTYEVIGSAMKTQKKADEVISILSKRGINAKKVDVMPGRRIKISLGTFTDFDLAKKFQDSLRVKLRNPEIYIQTIKPKN